MTGFEASAAATRGASRVAQALRRYQRLLAVLAFVGLLLLAFRLSGLADHFELAALRHSIADHQAGGLLLFIGLFALGNLLQIPGWVFVAAAVFTLGAFWGGVATYVAGSFACVTTFGLFRRIGGDALRQLDHPWAKRLILRLDASPVLSVAALRLLFQTLPALNGALALSGVRFRDYLLGTLLGLPAPIAVYCVFFEQIATALDLH